MSEPISFSFDHQAINREWVVESIVAQAWGARRRPHDVEHSLGKSVVCGAFHGSHQIGFIRAITDERFFGYIGDLIVAKEYRGRGVGAQLLAQLLQHPNCSDVVNWMTTTQSAAGFFERLGFKRANSETNLVAKRHAIAAYLALRS